MYIEQEYKHFISDVIGVKINMTSAEISEILHELNNTLTDKKDLETVKKYIDEIKFLKDNVEIYQQNKEKTFYSYLRLNKPTVNVIATKKDKISPTLWAYKNRVLTTRVVSDKEAAAMRALNVEKYDIFEEEKNSPTKCRGNRDYDQVSFLNKYD